MFMTYNVIHCSAVNHMIMSMLYLTETFRLFVSGVFAFDLINVINPRMCVCYETWSCMFLEKQVLLSIIPVTYVQSINNGRNRIIDD